MGGLGSSMASGELEELNWSDSPSDVPAESNINAITLTLMQI